MVGPLSARGAMTSGGGLMDMVARESHALVRDGRVWSVGLRVTTRCELAGDDKCEYAAGAAGRVWDIIDEDLLLIAIDNPACELLLVAAEPCDLDSEGFIPVNAQVYTHRLKLTRGCHEKIIPSATRGQIVSHNPTTNSYIVKFVGKTPLVAEAPCHVVCPVIEPSGRFKRAVQATAGLVKNKLLRISSRESVNRGTGSFCSSTGAMSSPGDQDISVLNLAKVPQFSSLAASPRSAKVQCAPRSPMYCGVSWELESQQSLPHCASTFSSVCVHEV